MRALLARVSILLACVLAVSAAARGQSPALTSMSPPVLATSDEHPTAASWPETPAPPASAGTNNFVAKFINSTDFGNSAVHEILGKVGVGTTNPLDSMHITFSDSGDSVTGHVGINNIASGGSINSMMNGRSKFLMGNDGDINIATGRIKKGGLRFFEKTAFGSPSLAGTTARFNNPQNAGAGQNQTPDAGAGQTPTPDAGAGQNQTPDPGAGQNQSVSANIGSHLKIFGTVKLDVIWNEARPQAPGVPFFLVPKFAGGFTNHTIDMNARQPLVGVLFTGPKIGNFQSGGRISAVFFDSSVLADTNGFLLQASYGELLNDQWRFAAGLQFDIFAPGLPTVLPFSYLGGSGSPGNCIRGQIRIERFVGVGSDSQLTLQGALSQPLNTYVTPDVILDEDNGWPNLEGRIAFGGGTPAPIGIGLLTQRPVEVGVSGLVGQLRRTAAPFDPPRRVVSDVWGAAVDFRVNLTGRFGFKGEVYSGQALGNYNGAILQSLDAVTWEPIRSTGGFVEGFVYLKPGLHSHTGYGIDDPNNNDMTAIPNTLFGRTYNSTLYSNLLWDLNKTFRIAFEATYRETKYKEPTNLPNYGVGFHTQFQWTF